MADSDRGGTCKGPEVGTSLTLGVPRTAYFKHQVLLSVVFFFIKNVFEKAKAHRVSFHTDYLAFSCLYNLSACL